MIADVSLRLLYLIFSRLLELADAAPPRIVIQGHRAPRPAPRGRRTPQNQPQAPPGLGRPRPARRADPTPTRGAARAPPDHPGHRLAVAPPLGDHLYRALAADNPAFLPDLAQAPEARVRPFGPGLRRGPASVGSGRPAVRSLGAPAKATATAVSRYRRARDHSVGDRDGAGRGDVRRCRRHPRARGSRAPSPPARRRPCGGPALG